MSENTYRWLTPLSQQFLDNDYLVKGQSTDNRVDVICYTAEKILGESGFAKALKSNIQKGWYSLSTPIWTNFGNKRGLPCSCYGSYISDSMSSIMGSLAEVGMMTKFGGGTSAYFGNLRGRGSDITDNGMSSGAVHFMGPFDSVISAVNQGNRRGNFAAHLPIDHADIEEFLAIKGKGHPIQHIFPGVTVTNAWMESMIEGDKEKRKIWAKVLASRADNGLPYITFIDNVNDNAVDVYKDKGLKIVQSNLCQEICLFNSPDESFVCDLSSMNILYFDEWRETNAVELLVKLLDAVMTEFINKAKNEYGMDRAVKFAENQRAIGIGWLGWHSYLQSKMIPFESMDAKYANITVAKTIQEQSHAASCLLAGKYGEPKLLKGYGRRHVTTTSIAPTKSSAFIIGQVSEGIEPHRSNYYIKDLAKGKFTIKNLELEKLLEVKGFNTEDIWESILINKGSVQHLSCLTSQEKDVFKTFEEISPREIIIQAVQRQKYLDQSQSLNLYIHPSIPIKDVNALMIEAWRMGLKTLYYQVNENSSQEFARDILSCKSCEA